VLRGTLLARDFYTSDRKWTREPGSGSTNLGRGSKWTCFTWLWSATLILLPHEHIGSHGTSLLLWWNYYVCALLSCMWRILEGTKGYICDAVVAVIDHLGTVSSKLEHKLQEKTDVTLTERKINFLKQVGLLLFILLAK
jgi:hypothetical protein